jgi:hypothetical protein
MVFLQLSFSFLAIVFLFEALTVGLISGIDFFAIVSILIWMLVISSDIFG